MSDREPDMLDAIEKFIRENPGCGDLTILRQLALPPNQAGQWLGELILTDRVRVEPTTGGYHIKEKSMSRPHWELAKAAQDAEKREQWQEAEKFWLLAAQSLAVSKLQQDAKDRKAYDAAAKRCRRLASILGRPS